MKPLSDEEIQKLLENGKNFPDTAPSADYQMYRHVFEVLKIAPDLDLSDDFSDHMVYVVSKQIIWRQNFRYYLLLSLVSVLAIALGIGVIAFVNMPLVIRLFSFLWEEKWIVLCVLIFFIFIQISDQLLKKHVLYPSHLSS